MWLLQPLVNNEWGEEDRLREVKERCTSDYVLYVITADIKGVYSIAELVDDSNKRPDETIFCVLDKGMNSQMKRSLEAVKKIVAANGATVLASLEEIARFLDDSVCTADTDAVFEVLKEAPEDFKAELGKNRNLQSKAVAP